MPYEEQGLTQAQAEDLLLQHGPNKLPEKKKLSNFDILISQIKSPLVYVLLFAAVVTVILGDYKDSAIIGLAILINTVFGFVQERRANDALNALKKLIAPTVQVIRGGKLLKILAENLVPGDYVILHQGDRVAADGVLIQAHRAFLNESILTGESLPVEKATGSQVYMGTIVSSGQALMKAEKTGEETQMGKIAESVQDFSFDTPLRRQLTKFSNQLVVVVIALVLFVLILGILEGRGFIDIFTTSVALAVSAIPEGLLVALTVVLAIGMQRILKRKGLVRNLVSAETLGGVTTICTDKTGTLTEGKMQVVDFVGEEEDLAHQVLLSNDLDDPMVVAGFEWAQSKLSNHQAIIDRHPRLDSIPFSSENRFFATLHKGKTHNMLYVSGAPEYLLDWSNLTKSQQKQIDKQIGRLASEGKRIIAFARKRLKPNHKSIKTSEVKSKLEFVGILGFSDPVRSGVKQSLERTHAAGIKLIVITGDYAQTAKYVLSELGINLDQDQIVEGQDLAKMSSDKLAGFLSNRGQDVLLFARTTPDQKLKIVDALKTNGEVVAMMGDGVNDAPALKRSDVGIVVGEATDVAKESSDLVLLDSSFETIVAAVEEGRGIFDNIRKIVLYLMCDAFTEIVAVVISLILGLPLPVTAAQILWINIVSDGFPNIALTVDPKRKNIMNQAPRDPKEALAASWIRWLIFIVSISGGVLAMVLFLFAWNQTADIVYARSIAFAALGVNSLVYVFSVRNLKLPIWHGSLLRNPWLIVAVGVGLVLQILPYIWPTLGSYFEVIALGLSEWVSIFAVAIATLILIELSKVIFRHKLR